MGLFEQFPYTNFHELNLDWILTKIKEFQTRLDEFQDTILKQANAYTDSQLAGIRADFATLEGDFAAFKVDVNKQFSDYTAKTNKTISDFENLVNAKLVLIQQDIRDAKAELQTLLNQSMAYTDNSIKLLGDRLPDMISANIKYGVVYNLLEGKYVTVQAMFDYLALFHAPGALTNNAIYLRNNTNLEIFQYGKTCQEFITDAKNFVIDRS